MLQRFSAFDFHHIFNLQTPLLSLANSESWDVGGNGVARKMNTGDADRHPLDGGCVSRDLALDVVICAPFGWIPRESYKARVAPMIPSSLSQFAIKIE